MTDEREPCWYCNQPIDHEPGVRVFEDSPLELAHESCQDKVNERAYDQSVEDFYGSSTPQTDRERGAIAADEKRRLG
jgi:hypothetical protein